MKSIPTIADIVLQELRDLDIKAHLSSLRDEGLDPTLNGLKKLGVLHDLSPDLQRRLAELIHNFWAEGETDRYITALWQDARVWRDDGPRRLRTMKRKMQKAHAAIRAVRRYVQRLHLTTGRVLDDALDRALTILDPTSLGNAEAAMSTLKTAKADAIGSAMRALYDFFVTDCKVEKKGAEVRVGKIGKHFWNWNVEVIERSSSRDEKWKGCAAVRKAVARPRKHSAGHGR